MRRLLAAGLTGVLTGSIFTTISPATTTEAWASSVTVGSCEVTVTVSGTALTGPNADNEIGAPSDDPSHVMVSEDNGDCILQFVEESVTMVATLPTGVTELDALVVAGGGGGAFGGGGAGAMFDTTQNDTASGEETLTVTDSGSDGVSVEVRVGAGGAGASPVDGTKATNGSRSWIDPEGAAKITRYGGVGGYERPISDTWTTSAGGNYVQGGTNSGGSTAGAVLVRSDNRQDSRTAFHPVPDVDFGRAGGDASISNGCTGQERSSGTGLFAVAGGGGGAGGIGKSGVGTNSCQFNSDSGNGGRGLASSIVPADDAAGGEKVGGAIFYAGGGGSGSQTRNSGSPRNGAGGDGGGEDAVSASNSVASSAARTTNTGGGGGGRSLGNDDALTESASESWSKDGTGGDSGIVVLRYAPPRVEIDQAGPLSVDFGGTAKLSATAAAGGSLAWSSGPGCEFDDNTATSPTVTPSLDAGESCTVTVTETVSGGGTTQDSIQLNVQKVDQAALSVANSGDIGFDGSVEMTTSGGSGDGVVTWRRAPVGGDDCSKFSITGSTLSTSANVGVTCTVEATKESSTNYNTATATVQFTVGQASPVFDSYSAVSGQQGSADVTLTDPTLQVNGAAFSAGSIAWTSADDTVADVTGSTLSFLTVGETTLTATFTPTDTTNYKTVTLDVAVTVTAIPAANNDDDDEEVVSPVPSATPAPVAGPRGLLGRPGPDGGQGVPPRAPGNAPPVPGGVPGVPTPPERPTATVGGVPVPTTTTASPGGRGVSVSAGGVDVGVDVPDPGDGRGGVVDRDGVPEPVVTPGQGKTVSGGGAAPGSVVDVWLPGRGGAGPTNVAQIPVGADGSFSADIDLFGGSDQPLPIGRNVLQVVTTNADGEQILVDMPFTLAQGVPRPEVLAATGDTPNAPAEGIVNTNRGDPTVTRVTSVPDQGIVSVESDTWAFTVGINTDSGVVEGADTDTLIRTSPNSQVTVSGSGFMPETRVDIWAFSTPTLLGNATVGADGTVTVTVALTPQALGVGAHTLQLQAVGEDGFIRTSNLPVEIESAPVAVTTSDGAGTLLWWTVSIAVAVIVLALLARLLIRRRQAD